jgi:hypothetical protein
LIYQVIVVFQVFAQSNIVNIFMQVTSMPAIYAIAGKMRSRTLSWLAGMTSIRTRSELLAAIDAGARPDYLLFWGHRPAAGGKGRVLSQSMVCGAIRA